MAEDKKEIVAMEVISAVPVKQSPIEMASSLIAQKADPEFIQKMLDVQIKYEENEAKKAYHVAMAEFKKDPLKILKDKTVSYGKTRYQHASLGNVTESINSKLSKHGFSTSWKTEQSEKGIKVTCTVTHSMGHSECTALVAPADTTGQKNTIQAIGSTVSYLSRYTLLAITGQATYDQDDDGVTSEPGGDSKKEKSPKVVISVDQLTDLKDKLKEKGVSEDTILREYSKKNMWTLTHGDYLNAIDRLKLP